MMIHGRRMVTEIDRNDDGFMDIPGDEQINLYSRWQYHSRNKLESQIGLKFIDDRITGGQTEDKGSNRYKTSVLTTRLEAFGKLGLIFPEKPAKSIGKFSR